MNEKQAVELTAQVMGDETPLPVEICIREAWLLVSGLQLCTRHPELSVIMRESLEHVGRQFQAAIVSIHPEVEFLLEMGWDATFDVPRKGDLCPNCDGFNTERVRAVLDDSAGAIWMVRCRQCGETFQRRADAD